MGGSFAGGCSSLALKHVEFRHVFLSFFMLTLLVFQFVGMNAFRSERYLKVEDFRSFKTRAPICFHEFLWLCYALLCQTLLKALEEIFYKNRRGL